MILTIHSGDIFAFFWTMKIPGNGNDFFFDPFNKNMTFIT